MNLPPEFSWIGWLLAAVALLVLWQWLRSRRREPAESAPPPYVPGVTIRSGTVPGVPPPVHSARTRLEAFLGAGDEITGRPSPTATVAPVEAGHSRQRPASRAAAAPPQADSGGMPAEPDTSAIHSASQLAQQAPSHLSGATEQTATLVQQEGSPTWPAPADDLPFGELGGAVRESGTSYFPDGGPDAVQLQSTSLEAIAVAESINWLFRPENLALAVLVGEILRRPAHFDLPGSARRG